MLIAEQMTPAAVELTLEIRKEIEVRYSMRESRRGNSAHCRHAGRRVHVQPSRRASNAVDGMVLSIDQACGPYQADLLGWHRPLPVCHLRMQTLRMHRCSLCGSRIRFTR